MANTTARNRTGAKRQGGDDEIVRAALGAARGSVVTLAIFSCALNLLVLTGPIYMLQVYDRVLSSRSVETLVAVSILAAVMYAAYGLLEFIRSALFGRIAAAAERRLGPRVIEALLRANLQSGRRSSQALHDMRSIRTFVGSPAPGAVFDAPWSPLFVIVTALIHPLLGLFSLGSIAILATLAYVNQARSQGKTKEASQASMAADQIADAAFSGLESIEAMGMRRGLERRWRDRNEESLDLNSHAAETTAQYGSASKALRFALQSGVLGLGAWLAIRGDITPGMMIAGSILLGRALAPIEQVIGQWRPAMNAWQSYQRLRSLLEAAPASETRMSLPRAQGALSVERVFAGPPNSNAQVLKGVTFKLDPGDGLGVIGPSGGGKSTLARIILGIWKPMAGAVRLDSASLEDWDRDELGPQIGYLSQAVDLLPGTVAQNIARFADEPDAEAVVAAAQKAGAHDMILRLPQGYDTDVGDAGRNLSAGQRQRVGLARALFGNPAFIVLDEPNSNLDKDGEEALLRAMAELRRDKVTTVIIAHRPNVLASCNKVLVLADGQVRGFGPRDEMLARLAGGGQERRNG